jgi:hypothetical protein
MNQPSTLILFFLIGVALTFYGWWCLFRTDSAVQFGWNPLLNDRGNWLATKLHGIVALVLGPSMCMFCVAHSLFSRSGV